MRKLQVIFAVFILLASVSFGQALDKNNDAKKLYNEATRLRKSGNYKGAVEKYDAALNLVDDYRLHFGKAQALRKMHRYEEAIQEYEITKKLKPDYYPAYFYMGAAYFALQNYEKAKENFDQVLKMTKSKSVAKAVQKNLTVCNEKLAYPYLVKGQTEAQQGNYRKAIKDFNKVLEYYDSDAAYLGLADAYNELGEYQKSLEYASKAIAHRKTIPEGSPYFYIGLAYKNMGQPEQAKQNFENCLRDKSKANKGFRKRAKFEMKQMKNQG
jgi:tetratricopeptide (TPR) repeat protein